MEKSKRDLLGVEKKTKSTKQIKKKLLSNVLDYFKSDSYMFAPLISPSPSGTKLKEPIKGNKKIRVLRKVGKYMKSDTYMYSPLLSSHRMPSPPSEKAQCIRKVTMEVSTSTLNTESANAIAEKQPSKDARLGLSIAENQTLVHRESVKHMVYQHCCSTPVSGKAVKGTKLRKLVVE